MVVSRTTKHPVETASRVTSKSWVQEEVTWEEVVGWLAAPVESIVKEKAGCYILGALKTRERKKDTVKSRWAVAIDSDKSDPDFLNRVRGLGVRLAWHTTHSHTPDNPRYRILIPLDRDVTPDEYFKIAVRLTEDLGPHNVDSGSFQPSRLMFRPSTWSDKEYLWEEVDGPTLSASETLARQVESPEDLDIPFDPRTKRDPFSLSGYIGAFNRTYTDLDTLIEKFDLPYVKSGERWRFVEHDARSKAGMCVVGDGLWYSWHETDPAFNQGLNAFDLIRIHKFIHLDEDVDDSLAVNMRPSQKAAKEFVSEDQETQNEMDLRAAMEAADTFSSVTADTDDDEDETVDPEDFSWMSGFDRTARTGNLKPTQANWNLIVKHDPVLRCLGKNMMSRAPEVVQPLPWRDDFLVHPAWTESDENELRDHLEGMYPPLAASKDRAARLVDKAASRNAYHPVKDYLESLEGLWDGKNRLETAFAGVRDTPTSQIALRIALIGAVTRIFEPGCKMDYSLVLFGKEGLGKTRTVEAFSRGHTTTLTDITNKDSVLAAARSWVAVSDEGHTLMKSEVNQMKEFLTRQHDDLRRPYGKGVETIPRSFVVWGTTNNKKFLQDVDGNRRFHIVHFDKHLEDGDLTPEHISQVWAEAVHRYREGERPVMTRAEEVLMVESREEFTNRGSVMGQISGFVSMPVPNDWETLGLEEQQDHYRSYVNGFANGDQKIEYISPLQVWKAILNDPRSMTAAQEAQILATLERLPGWVSVGLKNTRAYGEQETFARLSQKVLNELEDLL